jgi:hypothetical protein
MQSVQQEEGQSSALAEDRGKITKRKGSAFAPRKKRESAARNEDLLAEAATPQRDAPRQTSWSTMAKICAPVVQAEADYNRKRARGKRKGYTKFDTITRRANEADPAGTKRKEAKANFFLAHHYAGKRTVIGKKQGNCIVNKPSSPKRKKGKYGMKSLLEEHHRFILGDSDYTLEGDSRSMVEDVRKLTSRMFDCCDNLLRTTRPYIFKRDKNKKSARV